jgi:hypothetical protein
MQASHKFASLQQKIIASITAMDVDTLREIIPIDVNLTGTLENDREAFFELLQDKFKTIKKRGVKQYKVSSSFCNNCYDNKEVTRFSESYGCGFALAFEFQDSTLTSIRICRSAGIGKEDLVKHSHLTFSYF